MPADAPDATRPLGARGRAVAGIALGFVTLSAQVLLLRELWCATWGSEALAGIALAVWLAAGGAGSALGARAVKRLLGAGAGLVATLAALALAMPGAIVLLRWWPAAASDAPGAAPDLIRSALYALASLGAVGFLAGALFPLVLKHLFAGDGDAGPARLYRWDMVGSLMAGVALTAAVLAFGLGGLRGAFLVGVVALVLAAWLSRRKTPAVFLVVGATALALLAFPDLDRWTLAWRHPAEKVLSVAETAAGRLVLTERQGQTNAYLSGRFAASPGAVERAEAVAAVAAGECARPERALLLGDALASSARSRVISRNMTRTPRSSSSPAASGTT